MDNTQTMLRAIINGQSALKEELIKRIDDVENKLGTKIDNLDKKIDRVDEKLTKRIDNLGKQLAYLEDDAPTREEFDDIIAV
ncbi:MAG: hypothetical protein AAB546_00195 [Patescibacteria group bacterium]